MRPSRWFPLLIPALLPGADWPRFRGPNGGGTASAEALPVEFSPSSNVAWKMDVPFGRSSPILFGHNLYLTASEGSKLLTLAIHSGSGKSLWRREITKARETGIYKANDPASPTPAADEGGVYAFFPDFGVVAYSHSGTELWRHPLAAFKNFYGMSSSPIVAAGQVILQCDQTGGGSYLLALDTKSGKPRWRQERAGSPEGWSTPIVHQDQLIVFGTTKVEGYHLSTGEPRWSFPISSNGSMGSPVVFRDTVIVTASGSDRPWLPAFAAVRAKVDTDRNGILSKQEARDEKYWFEHFGWVDANDDGGINEAEWNVARAFGVGDFGAVAIPLLRRGSMNREAAMWRFKRSLSYVPAPVLYGDVFYMARDGGIISSLNPASGEVYKQGRTEKGRGQYLASPVAGDGKVYVLSEEGILTVLKAGAQWEVLATNDMAEECYATPAIQGNRLFVRTRSKLYAFEATGK